MDCEAFKPGQIDPEAASYGFSAKIRGEERQSNESRWLETLKREG